MTNLGRSIERNELTLHWSVAGLGLVGGDAGPRRRARGCSAIDIAVGVVVMSWSVVNIET